VRVLSSMAGSPRYVFAMGSALKIVARRVPCQP
jgi:hypothetical protein